MAILTPPPKGNDEQASKDWHRAQALRQLELGLELQKREISNKRVCERLGDAIASVRTARHILEQIPLERVK